MQNISKSSDLKEQPSNIVHMSVGQLGSIALGYVHLGPGFNPWVGKISWRSTWPPTPYSCLEKPMDRGAWWAPKQCMYFVHTLSMGIQRVVRDWVTKHSIATCPSRQLYSASFFNQKATQGIFVWQRQQCKSGSRERHVWTWFRHETSKLSLGPIYRWPKQVTSPNSKSRNRKVCLPMMRLWQNILNQGVKNEVIMKPTTHTGVLSLPSLPISRTRPWEGASRKLLILFVYG